MLDINKKGRQIAAALSAILRHEAERKILRYFATSRNRLEFSGEHFN
ncbi:MAG: hypothetical protein HY391_03270 [Deltaproteobacteria bacterium]|nr:hypothetical protein [Deltaproteobacteria bacterium]